MSLYVFSLIVINIKLLTIKKKLKSLEDKLMKVIFNYINVGVLYIIVPISTNK